VPLQSSALTGTTVTATANAKPASSALSTVIYFEPGPRLPIPWVGGFVRAGFPSPAEDFAARRHDLNELLITHPAATFMWMARGLSMLGAGIGDGDLLVVNRALTPQHRDIVVAEIDNDFTVKYLHKRAGQVRLVAADPTFPPILLKDGQTLVICGVVTATIKRHRK
jgi:DNA polymerase V